MNLSVSELRCPQQDVHQSCYGVAHLKIIVHKFLSVAIFSHYLTQATDRRQQETVPTKSQAHSQIPVEQKMYLARSLQPPGALLDWQETKKTTKALTENGRSLTSCDITRVNTVFLFTGELCRRELLQ